MKLDCQAVDELDAAFALDAVEADEQRAILDHLSGCGEAHRELRAMLGAGTVLSAAEPSVRPRPELRARILATVAATPQDHRVGWGPRPSAAEPLRRGWFERVSPGLSRGLAAAGLAAALLLGIWNVGLQGEVTAARRVAEALASAEAVYSVSGEAGRGLLLQTSESPLFLPADVDASPQNRIYVLWLIDAGGKPLAVGTMSGPRDELALIPLERDLSGFVTFAVTVEEDRVTEPRGPVVLTASLEG